MRQLKSFCPQRLAAVVVALAAVLVMIPGSMEAARYSNAPVSGNMSSPFGWRSDPMSGQHRFHAGIDIAAPYGSPVYAPQDAVVAYSGAYGGYGNVVVLQHAPKFFTLYGHNSHLFVKYGDKIRRGQVIALVGSTGRSTGPHLHFEVHQNNAYVNPLDYLAYLQKITLPYLAQVTAVPKAPAQPADASTATTRKKYGKSMEVVAGSRTKTYEF